MRYFLTLQCVNTHCFFFVCACVCVCAGGIIESLFDEFLNPTELHPHDIVTAFNKNPESFDHAKAGPFLKPLVTNIMQLYSQVGHAVEEMLTSSSHDCLGGEVCAFCKCQKRLEAIDVDRKGDVACL